MILGSAPRVQRSEFRPGGVVKVNYKNQNYKQIGQKLITHANSIHSITQS